MPTTTLFVHGEPNSISSCYKILWPHFHPDEHLLKWINWRGEHKFNNFFRKLNNSHLLVKKWRSDNNKKNNLLEWREDVHQRSEKNEKKTNKKDVIEVDKTKKINRICQELSESTKYKSMFIEYKINKRANEVKN